MKFKILFLFIVLLSLFQCKKADTTDGSWSKVTYSTMTDNVQVLDVNFTSSTSGYNTLSIAVNIRATSSQSTTYYGTNTQSSKLYTDSDKKNEVGNIFKQDTNIVLVLYGTKYTGIVNKYVP
ncbi:MAG: hypothetical protein ACKOW9_03175 [Candidatus Paceibacterota bacterium]